MVAGAPAAPRSQLAVVIELSLGLTALAVGVAVWLVLDRLQRRRALWLWPLGPLAGGHSAAELRFGCANVRATVRIILR